MRGALLLFCACSAAQSAAQVAQTETTQAQTSLPSSVVIGSRGANGVDAANGAAGITGCASGGITNETGASGLDCNAQTQTLLTLRGSNTAQVGGGAVEPTSTGTLVVTAKAGDTVRAETVGGAGIGVFAYAAAGVAVNARSNGAQATVDVSQTGAGLALAASGPVDFGPSVSLPIRTAATTCNGGSAVTTAGTNGSCGSAESASVWCGNKEWPLAGSCQVNANRWLMNSTFLTPGGGAADAPVLGGGYYCNTAGTASGAVTTAFVQCLRGLQ